LYNLRLSGISAVSEQLSKIDRFYAIGMANTSSCGCGVHARVEIFRDLIEAISCRERLPRINIISPTDGVRTGEQIVIPAF